MPNTPKMNTKPSNTFVSSNPEEMRRFRQSLIADAEKRDKKLSNVLQAGERGADKAVSKVMKNVPGSSGPPKGLVDALEPAIRYLGRRSRGENTDKKAAGGVVKPRGYGMARGGKACKMM